MAFTHVWLGLSLIIDGPLDSRGSSSTSCGAEK